MKSQDALLGTSPSSGSCRFWLDSLLPAIFQTWACVQSLNFEPCMSKTDTGHSGSYSLAVCVKHLQANLHIYLRVIVSHSVMVVIYSSNFVWNLLLISVWVHMDSASWVWWQSPLAAYLMIQLLMQKFSTIQWQLMLWVTY